MTMTTHRQGMQPGRARVAASPVVSPWLCPPVKASAYLTVTTTDTNGFAIEPTARHLARRTT